MRTRALAGVVVATWAKTVAIAPATAGANPAQTARASRQPIAWPPPVQAPSVEPPRCPAPAIIGPALDSTYGRTDVQAITFSFNAWDKSCPGGSLELQATADGSHWKTLDTEHSNLSWGSMGVRHECFAGTWTYRATFTADDLSSTGSHSATFFC